MGPLSPTGGRNRFYRSKSPVVNMLLTACLAAVVFCSLATSEVITTLASGGEAHLQRSIDDIDAIGDVERAFREVEQANNDSQSHHIEKRSLFYGHQFVGTGYNLMRGNPEGGQSAHGGVDPGILPTRRHIKLSEDYCSGSYPPELQHATHSSCVTQTSKHIFHGTKSYQNNLKVGATVSASAEYGFGGFEFSASANYASAKEESENSKSVVLDTKTVCNRGRIRLKTELANALRFSVADGFAAAVCALPTTYHEASYMQFIEDFGTHSIIEVELGTKTVDRKRSKLSELYQFAQQEVQSSIRASGSYGGYSGSVEVNIDTMSSNSKFDSNFNNNLYKFTLGTASHPEPIGVHLWPIVRMLEPAFWSKITDLISRGICPSGTTHDNKIRLVKNNVDTALKNYVRYLRVRKSSDPELKIPLVWPQGTYSLVKPRTGCPVSPAPGAVFHEGYRYHDTEDSSANSYWSRNLQLAGAFYKTKIRWHFCSKTLEHFSPYLVNWGKGKYCIVKIGACPNGFTEGTLKWDDEDSRNGNTLGGFMPEGTYTHDTWIKFCCRTDGHVENAIFLPTHKPFILLKKSDTCQKVFGMTVTEQYVRWDDEDSNNANQKTGNHPYDDGGSKNHRLHFCVYR